MSAFDQTGQTVGTQVNVGSERPTTNAIALAQEFHAVVESGQKTQTIRPKIRPYTLGAGRLYCDETGWEMPIIITGLHLKRFGDIDQGDAHREGMPTLLSLKNALRQFYPGLTADDIMTVVTYERSA